MRVQIKGNLLYPPQNRIGQLNSHSSRILLNLIIFLRIFATYPPNSNERTNAPTVVLFLFWHQVLGRWVGLRYGLSLGSALGVSSRWALHSFDHRRNVESRTAGRIRPIPRTTIRAQKTRPLITLISSVLDGTWLLWFIIVLAPIPVADGKVLSLN